jgi:catechol 2,3-dioxygenase-like lactoylglutathione lyase family enzyme
MMLFTGIDHPAIACCDVRKQIEWYCRYLGMRVIASNDADPPGVIVGYGNDARGGAMIELMPARDEGDRPAEVPRFAPGLRHVALRVNDFEKAYAQLKSAGVNFIGEPGAATGGGRIVSFRDPEGNELQIVER